MSIEKELTCKHEVFNILRIYKILYDIYKYI